MTDTPGSERQIQKCVMVCLQEESSRLNKQNEYCDAPYEEKGAEEEGVSMQFLSFPQPPKNKNNAHYSGQS